MNESFNESFNARLNQSVARHPSCFAFLDCMIKTTVLANPQLSVGDQYVNTSLMTQNLIEAWDSLDAGAFSVGFYLPPKFRLHEI